METLFRDVRYALVTMRRQKAFAAAALVTLALGIGATTAVFSVVYGVLLRPLPYPEPDRLVRLGEEHQGATSPLTAPMLSNLTYHAWNQSPRTIDQLGAYRMAHVTVTAGGSATQLDAAQITPSLFGMLGATPALGRLFAADEGAEGSDALVVLTDRGWREQFDADPSVVGRGVTIDGKPAVIVGVTRAGFSFPTPDTLLFTPRQVQRPSPDAVAGQRGLINVVFAIARLKAGVTPAPAEAEGTAAARSTVRPMAANLLFGVGGPPLVRVQRMADEATARVRPALLLLAAAVICVLLIACANVANLFLSRGVARHRDLTVRAAIGASRARLVRQLLTESLVLSTIGGLVGLVLAWALVRAIPTLASRDFPRLDAVAIDARTIAFALAATLLTAIVTGLAPALRSARFELAESLHGGDGATAGGFRGARARRMGRTLLAFESAFAVLLLVAAALLARSFVRLVTVDPGYTAGGVLTAQVWVPAYDAPETTTAAGRAKAERMRQIVEATVARLRATPAVVAAGAGSMLPLDGTLMIAGFPAPWTPPGGARGTARAIAYTVTPGYADALALRVHEGRLFMDADQTSAVRAWIVNEEFARLYLPRPAAGYRFEQTSDTGPIQVEIVGVVANVLKNGNDTKPQPEMYVLARDRARFVGRFDLALRTSDDPASLAAAVRTIVHDVEPTAALRIVTLSQRVSESIAQPRFAMTVLVAFAALALALSAVGLYGVLSYGVSQRRREFGVRAALGASRGEILALVLREGLATSGLGLLFGVVAAAALTRLMQAVLFGVTPLDPVSFAVAPAVLIVVAIAACLLPARRAAATDPAEALRCE